MLTDPNVQISSRLATLRASLTVTNPALPADTGALFTAGLPRVFVSAEQTAGAVAATMTIQFAVRMNPQNPSAPEWISHSTVTLVPGTPVNTNVEIGAVYVRFLVSGAASDTVEIAASAFV